jgi:hypothetical protein
MHIKFWVENLKERHHLEDPEINADSSESKVFLVHAMKCYGGMEVRIYSFLTLAPNGGKWLPSRSGLLCPQGEKL